MKTTLEAFIVQSPDPWDCWRLHGGGSKEFCAGVGSGNPLTRAWLGVLLSGPLCLFFREMFPFLGWEASRENSEKDSAKVLGVEITALLVAGDGGMCVRRGKD